MNRVPEKPFIKIPEINWNDDVAIDVAAAQLREVITTWLGTSTPAEIVEQGGNCE